MKLAPARKVVLEIVETGPRHVSVRISMAPALCDMNRQQIAPGPHQIIARLLPHLDPIIEGLGITVTKERM